MTPTTTEGWSHARALGVGELLWDLLPDGPRLGGAPFNTIAHLRRLGMAAAYVTAVGRDDLGRRAREALDRLGVDGSLIQTADAPTGVARVKVDDRGEPAFEIVSPAAYEQLQPLSANALARLGDTDVLVFGTLAQRFEGMLGTTRALAGIAPQALRIFDVNLRPDCWNPGLVEELLSLAVVAKMNAAERDVLAAELELPAAPTERFARLLGDRFELRGVCVTFGPDGAGLLLDGDYREAAAIPVEVVDTIGAGDAFTAGLTAAIIASGPASEVLDLASRLAAVVASRHGAIPSWELSEVGLVEHASPSAG
jgi:fructokinase